LQLPDYAIGAAAGKINRIYPNNNDESKSNNKNTTAQAEDKSTSDAVLILRLIWNLREVTLRSDRS
jgi:hypothetical protein